MSSLIPHLSSHSSKSLSNNPLFIPTFDLPTCFTVKGFVYSMDLDVKRILLYHSQTMNGFGDGPK